MNKFDSYVFRASSLGKIMGSGRGQIFTEVGKAYLRECWVEKTLGIKPPQTSSSAIRKGHINEHLSLQILREAGVANVFKLNIENIDNLRKVGSIGNESITNGMVMGRPDAITEDTVIDTKTSEHIWSFLASDMTDIYEWQLKAYMWILGYKKAILAYVLTDMPEELINEYILKAGYSHRPSTEEEAEKLEETVRNQFIYGSKLSARQRIKLFNISLTDTDINLMVDRINLARQYLNTLQI